MKKEEDVIIQVPMPFCIQEITSKKVTIADVLGACANAVVKFKENKKTLEKVMREETREFPKGEEDERMAEFMCVGVLRYFTNKLKLDDEQNCALQDAVSMMVAEIKKMTSFEEMEKTMVH